MLEEAAALRPALQESIAQKLPQYNNASLPASTTQMSTQQQQQQRYLQRMRGLFLRLLGCDAGAAFLTRSGHLDALLRPQAGGTWAIDGGSAFGLYPRAVERRLAQAALAMANPGGDAPPFVPLPPPTAASSSADAGAQQQQQQCMPRPTPIVIRCQELAAPANPGGGGLAQDMRALLALPWRIEVRGG